MVTKYKVRRKSKELFKQVINLRKEGYSYSEIRKETGLAKSTINNWLTLSGLVLSKEHIDVQARKRVENYAIGVMASRITRKLRKEKQIADFIQSEKTYFNDPLFVSGMMLYEAEGSKNEDNTFSNSDYKVIITYLKFVSKYLNINMSNQLTFRLHIHKTREKDLPRIIHFWSQKLHAQSNVFRISWKHNIVTKPRENKDYVGQCDIRIKKFPYFTSKMKAVSSIILDRFIRE